MSVKDGWDCHRLQLCMTSVLALTFWLHATGEQQPGGTAAFLKSATAEVYGTSGDVASLEDRVGRRKYYAERGGGQGFKR